ncbi:TlpA family protein disulfide reductase [Candidatus Poriferisodalis sp.]|uniref:TlpA family protein disulfide reductase n=1 Tax=Candidatus Poriferisodalis sp. TaxID=3101277 RepID=UPI003C6F11B7
MIVGVAAHDSIAAFEGFVSSHGLEQMPHFGDESGDLWDAFGVRSQPTWMLVRADGTTERGQGHIPGEIVTDALSPA